MFDFTITDSGELVYDYENSGLKKSTEDELRRQIAVSRIKSVTGNWFNTLIGANLEGFIGSPCNTETYESIEQAIINSLTNDELFDSSEIFLIPKIDKTSISILVFLKSRYGTNPKIINVNIDIVSGVKVQYDSITQ